MKLSIVVPIRNGEQYLEECLDSICRQTMKEFELILVNNASTDRSQEIIEQYREKDNRIVTFYADGLKANAVRKIGLDYAKGTYVTFVDCDDWIEADMYEVLVGECEKWDLDMISSSMVHEHQGIGQSIKIYDTVEEGFYDKQRLKEEVYSVMMYREPFMTHGIMPNMWNKVFKKTILKRVFENLDTEIIYGEDATVVYSALLMSNRVEIIKKTFYHYRIHNVSNTFTAKEELITSALRLNEQFKKIFAQEEQNDSLLEQLKYFMLAVEMFNMQRCYEVDVWKMAQWFMPFGRVIAGKKIVVYGAGDVGKDFYRQLLRQEKEVLWVDTNYRKIENKIASVENPQVLQEKNVDYVIIAVYQEDIAKDIRQKVLEYGYKDEQILWQYYQKNAVYLIK